MTNAEKIEKAKSDLAKAKSRMRRRDLLKYLRRLNRECQGKRVILDGDGKT